jgi:DNA-binding CsgD family transcriptional regulator
VDDITASIAEMYDAIGDVNRWRRIEQRIVDSGEPCPEIAHHLALARRAHEQHVSALRAVEMLAAVHDQTALAALVVDNEGVLLHQNSAASRLFAADSGLRVADGRVEAVDSAERVTLRDSIADACVGARDRNMFVAITRPAGRRLCVVVLQAERLVVSVFERSALAVLVIIDPDAPGVAGARALRALFDFTAREAEVAALLMEGHTVDEASQILGISVATARTFLAHLAAKTDSHSQSELVRHLLAIPPLA